MAIANRLLRLIRSDMHGLIDTLEDPLATLKQAIREMQQQIDSFKNQLDEKSRLQDELQYKISSIKEKTSSIQDEIDLCFEEQNEELAKSRIKKRLQLQKTECLLNDRLVAVQEGIEELQGVYSDRQNKLNRIKEKYNVIADQRSNDEIYSDKDFAVEGADSTVSAEDVEIAFLQERKKHNKHEQETAGE